MDGRLRWPGTEPAFNGGQAVRGIDSADSDWFSGLDRRDWIGAAGRQLAKSMNETRNQTKDRAQKEEHL
jgi:hypothetical protein